MKKYITVVLMMLGSIIYAQDFLNYQAVIRDGSGSILTNSSVDIKFSILQTSPAGTVSYSESHTTSTNAFGLLNLEIGGGTVLTGSFSGIQWGDYDHFLKVEVNIGSGFVTMGTTQLNYVPYAFHAKSAENVANDNDNQTLAISGQDLTITGGNTVTLPSGGGTGDITAVTAGTGLTGGGTSGAVTLNAQVNSAIWNANELQGNTISSSSPTNGEVLKWNGSNWAPNSDDDDQTLAISGQTLSITGGNSVSLPAGGTGDITAVTAGTGITGGGTSGAVTLNAQTNSALWNANELQGKAIATTTPSSGQVLKWSGSAWAPATDAGTNYTMGDGLSLSGTTINSTWTTTGNSIRNTNTLYVGIGVTSPVDKLHVEGVNSASYLRITRPAFGSTSLDGMKLGYNNAGLAYLWNYENTNLNFATNNAIAMTIKTDGDVGIGTSAPVDKLHLHGTNTASYLRITRPSSGATALDGLSLGYNNSGVAYLLNAENTSMHFSTNATVRMTIENGGDVGIGTMSPTSPLHVYSASGIDPLRVQIAGATKLMVHDNGGLGIGSSTFTPPADGLLVDGNIAVGVTTPQSRVHVSSATSTSESSIRFTRSTTGITVSDGFWFGYSANSYNYMWGYENNNLSIGTNGVFRMTVQSDGDVGIGTASPSYDLQMGYNSAAKPTSSSWSVVPDSRLKNELGTFTDGLDLVMKIRPIQFRYNGDIGLPTDEIGIGTMAQELQQIAPYMVKPFVYEEGSSAGPEESTETSGTTKEYLAVDYGAMDFVLVNAVQELKEMIDEQQAVIEQLEQKIEKLENERK